MGMKVMGGGVRGWLEQSGSLWPYVCCSLSRHPPPPDMKWKNKFWGKSLEIVPVGTVNVSLPR